METNEQLHTRVLEDYKILEGAADTSYEDLIYVAAKIYQTPISGMRLGGQNHLWVKGGRGLSIEPSKVTPMCTDVIKHGSSLLVKDTLKDPRFQESPFRFYAGTPLMTTAGVIQGSLYVMDIVPHEGEDIEMRPLQALARQMMDHMEARNFKENREQELKTIHYSKLASLGEMAASIAHEINNPLAIINGNVGLLRRAMAKQNLNCTRNRLYLDSIESTVRRINKIIRGLKALCRGGEREPFEKIDLRESIATALSMVIKNFKSHGIEIRPLYKGSAAITECRAFQVEQIIVNLLTNSFDAIKNLQEKWIEIGLGERDTNWIISVTDSGKGIPSVLQDKIMTPFFTTKEGDQGTGLGLSISKSLAEEQGGRLELDSNYPNTRFVLTLPKKQLR